MATKEPYWVTDEKRRGAKDWTNAPSMTNGPLPDGTMPGSKAKAEAAKKKEEAARKLIEWKKKQRNILPTLPNRSRTVKKIDRTIPSSPTH